MKETLNLHWLQCAYKTCCRGGKFISEVFKKEEKILTAKECMKLKDTYGIRAEDVIKMTVSHDFSVDVEEFAKLLDEDEKKWKSVKPLVMYEKESCC